MSSVAKRHLVDGEWTTVAEAAARLGLTSQQIYAQMSHRSCSLQTVVRMYRENLILHHDYGARYMVDGEWISVRQAAKMLGVKHKLLEKWRYTHRVDGKPGSLADAIEAVRRGEVRYGGRRPVKHRVGNRMMTTFEAADMLGIRVSALWLHMSRNKATLEETIRYYEAKKKQQAEREIMAILNGE